MNLSFEMEGAPERMHSERRRAAIRTLAMQRPPRTGALEHSAIQPYYTKAAPCTRCKSYQHLSSVRVVVHRQSCREHCPRRPHELVPRVRWRAVVLPEFLLPCLGPVRLQLHWSRWWRCSRATPCPARRQNIIATARTNAQPGVKPASCSGWCTPRTCQQELQRTCSPVCGSSQAC
jgi:hypothetical protein